MTTENRWSLS
ncbi:hypothetical protein AVEN_96412-1, partial [Araneus ventricosus]